MVVHQVWCELLPARRIIAAQDESTGSKWSQAPAIIASSTMRVLRRNRHPHCSRSRACRTAAFGGQVPSHTQEEVDAFFAENDANIEEDDLEVAVRNAKDTLHDRVIEQQLGRQSH